jgi:hypothetical protein
LGRQNNISSIYIYKYIVFAQNIAFTDGASACVPQGTFRNGDVFQGLGKAAVPDLEIREFVHRAENQAEAFAAITEPFEHAVSDREGSADGREKHGKGISDPGRW